MLKRLLTVAVIASASAAGLMADDFFSTDKCDTFMDLGVRLGVNTSNRTIGKDAFAGAYHHENWGCGFDFGAVATLNIRDYIAIQPGVFFSHRAGSFTLMADGIANPEYPDQTYSVSQAGTRKTENLVIPVMAVVRLNVTDNVRWNVEAGPYLSILLSSSIRNKRVYSSETLDPTPLFTTTPSGCDFGFKLGTGLQLFDHWYVGVHYMAACTHAWKEQKVGSYHKDFGGLAKGWLFSIGYDF